MPFSPGRHAATTGAHAVLWRWLQAAERAITFPIGHGACGNAKVGAALRGRRSTRPADASDFKQGVDMHRKSLIALSVAAMSAGVPFAYAQSSGELRSDRQEIRGDRVEIRGDVRELRQDRQE